MSKGFIYVRKHFSYDQHNVCKLGRTVNIPSRDSQYSTGEYKRGYFSLVVEIEGDKLSLVEKLLQNYFKSQGYHRKSTGGSEFFSCDITNLIIPFLASTCLNYRIISDDEIKDLERLTYIKENMSKLKIFNGIKERRSHHNWLVQKESIILTPISKKYKNKGPDSRKDYDEQMIHLKDGKQIMWDDTDRNMAKENDIFIFVHNFIKLEIHRITHVLTPNHRLITWNRNAGHENRNVLYLTSKSVQIQWSCIPSMYKVQGTTMLKNVKVIQEISDYLKSH
jgi:hypothetical protein